MASSRRIPAGRPLAFDAQADTLSAKIIALKPLSGDVRARQIRDVVDAFRRLHGSVQRFVRMFAGARDVAATGDLAGTSLRELLSMLANEARAARFSRLRELKLAIRQARLLVRTRDAVFSEAFGNDPVAMRETVTALERVDAILVALCVEHVLERHVPATPHAQASKPAIRQKRQPAPVY